MSDRYATDSSFGSDTLRVQCLGCAKMLRLCDAIIDREGPAFKAYYHLACLNASRKTAPDALLARTSGRR